MTAQEELPSATSSRKQIVIIGIGTLSSFVKRS